MVLEEVRHQEEAARCAKAVSQAQQGRWMKWEGVERRKITWNELWSMETSRLSFIIKATYDVLPSPTNLHLWYREDPACLQCAAPANLKHILVGCKTSLTQGRYTWRHNQVLKCLAAELEKMRVTTNAMPLNAQSTFPRITTFVRKGRNGGPSHLLRILAHWTQREIGKCGWTSARGSLSHPKLQRPTCAQTWSSGPSPAGGSSSLSWLSHGRMPSMRHSNGRGCAMPT